MLIEYAEAPQQLHAFTAAEPDIHASERPSFVHVPDTETGSRSEILEEFRRARRDLTRIDEYSSLHVAMDWNAVFGLHQHEIAIAEPITPEPSKRGACAIRSK
jgi:hypothetical protein